jgi:YHS domain-containing protein
MKSKSIKWLGTLLGCLSLVVVVSAIAGPVNTKCPVSGKAVSKDAATYSVGLCCGNCLGKFTKDPAKFLGKVKAVAVNANCPMSGQAINAKFTAKHKGDVIGFCGAGCQKKFTADPSASIKQVKIARKTVNDKCPLSGKAIDPKKTYSVAFCCNNCAGKFKNAPAKSIAKVK